MILVSLAAGAAVVAAGYNTMSWRSQLYGRTFIGNGPKSRDLALTFDDGPNDVHTRALLEVLSRNDVPATFFLLGKYVDQRPEIAREIAAAGHVIGNHTYNHRNLILRSARELREEIGRCKQSLENALGQPLQPLFRPPQGGRRPAVLRGIRQLGLVPIMWSVAGWDWLRKTPEQIERNVLKPNAGGEVILLHDGGERAMGADRAATVRATEGIIRRYKERGYRFVTVPEMLASNPEWSAEWRAAQARAGVL